MQIRAVAAGAKIIGSNVGGVYVVVRNAETGEVLAQGTQQGETGNTDLLMKLTPIEAGDTVYDTEGAAGFLAVFDIEKPTMVEIEATGPLMFPHAMQRTVKRAWVQPGQQTLGEGIILEISGLVISFTEPAPATTVEQGNVLKLSANMTMMCGCIIQPDGLWDYNTMTFAANVIRDGEIIASYPLVYAGEPSSFSVDIPIDFSGPFTVRLDGLDAKGGNAGSTSRDFIAE